MDPLLLDVQNSQAGQGQDKVDSTSLEGANSNSSPIDLGNTQGEQAENPPGDVEPGSPISSVIKDRNTGPYELQDHQSNLIVPSEKSVDKRLDYDKKLEAQAEKDQKFLTSSNPGETFPIQSIMNVEPDTSDGPYDPCEERLYTLMTTKLNRTEAKKLRKKVRDSGWDPFDGPPWEPIVRPQNRTTGWQFRRADINQRNCLTSICSGNRLGIHSLLLLEGRSPWRTRRFLTIVQRDGGEVHINGLLAKPKRSTTAAALEVFDKFEV